MLNPLFRCVTRRSSARRGPRWLGLWLVLPALVLAVGCSGKDKKGAKDSITGKVMVGDKPAGGTLVFVYQDAKTPEKTTPIGKDGEYTMENAPPGKVKVVVRTMLGSRGSVANITISGGPDMPKIGPEASGATPNAKYQDAKTTPLEYDVQAGRQTKDFILDP